MPVLKEALQGICIKGKPAVFNHIIGTLYTEQKDEIGAHHDKMDIRAGSDIISLSLGDVREFVLTSKDGVEQQRVVLEDGDLFVLGPRTNEILKHAVLPVKDEQITERHGSSIEPRISIVLRDIKTQVALQLRDRRHTLSRRDAIQQVLLKQHSLSVQRNRLQLGHQRYAAAKSRYDNLIRQNVLPLVSIINTLVSSVTIELHVITIP
jgi:2OG-Fe(II) oxygenase superfamily